MCEIALARPSLLAHIASASFSRDGALALLHDIHASWLVDLSAARVEAVLRGQTCRGELRSFAASGAVLSYEFGPCLWNP